MIIKRNRIGGLVLGTLLLSTCSLVACAVYEDTLLNPAAGGSGQSSGSAGTATSGAAQGGSAGTAGASTGGASSGTGAGGGATGGDEGDGGGGGDGSGGEGGGTGGNGGGAGSGGNGGSATGGGGGAGGKGGVGGTAGAGGTGGAGNGGTGGTGGTAGAGTTVSIDLSTFQPVSAGSYSAASHTLTVVAQPSFQFQLPKAFGAGQSLAVHVTGTNNGTAGLRSWLVDGSQVTLSNMVNTYVGSGLVSGSFTLDYTLTATNSAQFLFFKGPNFSTNIDNVTISTITVTY